MSPVALFTLLTLIMTAFAANSVLGRLALDSGTIDPASYTTIRIAAGALMLAILVSRNSSGISLHGKTLNLRPALVTAFCLFAYAVTFSYAYLDLDAGLGALILFAMVQITMIGWGLVTGNRLGPLEWLGFISAMAGFVYLVSPGLAAPDPFASLLMAISGIAWGVYSLRGRGITEPVAATARNFVLATPMAIAVSIVVYFIHGVQIGAYGFALAVISGAITSALGYALWYRALPLISPTVAAVLQLTVPLIAALGGVLFVAEPLTWRFVLSSIAILGGVATVILAGRSARLKPAN
jgi:drug/metabolite transporter (DMT)-like permease